MTAVYNTSSGRLVSCHTTGRLSADQLSSCLREAGRAAALVRRLCRSAVAAKFSREPREPWAGPARAEDAPVSRQRLGGQHTAQQPAT